MIDILFLATGLVLLLAGGDILVRGAVVIAERMAIPPLIIGLTIVSIGTSAPELFISVQAALSGSGGLAIGNVVGSNIANVLLVLGVPAMVAMTCCDEEAIGRNIVVMIGVTLVFMAMLAKGSLGFLDGAILVALTVLFLWDQYRNARNGKDDLLENSNDTLSEAPRSLTVPIACLIGGIILLPMGAWLTVEAAHNIALSLGVPDEIIGLTIVAIGTSLPELAASLMAAIRGNTNVAIGNVVGSNILNIAAIMGITALIADLDVGDHIIKVDMWMMLAVAIWLVWLAVYKKRISRRSGVFMSVAYTIYLGAAFIK
ncbi:MAG: calcium/sodium antiporter [Pseudomonadota bacterium]